MCVALTQMSRTSCSWLSSPSLYRYLALRLPVSTAVVYIALNIVTNVSIILVNKYVFSIYQFNYATLVTFLHFVFTAYVPVGVLHCVSSMGVATLSQPPGDARPAPGTCGHCGSAGMVSTPYAVCAATPNTLESLVGWWEQAFV
jgi:hypothetical protein